MSAMRRGHLPEPVRGDALLDELRVIEGGAESARAVLRSVTLTGFKSFPSRTHIEFAPGITAIVGPNGSGKSNVAESIRWALGEGSAKALRAKKSEDLIFSGSETRRAIGMAEVVMHLDNSAARLPIDFTEVEIARRFYRDGESDYLVNRAKVRLRDLQDLLAGAHLADNPFVVIGQGLVDQVLALRPADRRIVIEEAAGTRRLHLRREEALNKIRAAEAELLRVTDILRELGPRRALLEEQAERWREYEAVRAELRRRALRWYRDSYGQSAAARDALGQRLAAVDEDIVALAQEIARAEGRVQAGDQNVTAARDAEESARADAEVAAAHAAESRERLAEARSALASHAAQRERAVEVITGLRAELTSLADRRAQVESEARASAESSATAANAVAPIERELGHRQAAMAAANAQRLAAERELLVREGAESRARAEAEALERHLVDTTDHIQRLLGDRTGLLSQHDELASALERARVAAGEMRAHVDELTAAIDQSRVDLMRLDAELLAAQSRERSLAEALVRVVEETDIRRRVLSEEPISLPEGASWLFDVVRIPAELEMAVRAVVGERAVLAGSSQQVTAVREVGRGDLSVIVPARGGAGSDGVDIGMALADLIEAADASMPVAVRDALAGAYLVEDESAALQRAADLPPGITLVTRSGVVVTRGVVRLPGDAEERQRAWGRLAELEELRSRLERERSEVARSVRSIAAERDTVHASVDRLTAALTEVAGRLEAQHQDVRETETHAAGVDEQLRALDARRAALEAQREELRARSVEVAREREAAAAVRASAAESFARAAASEKDAAAAHRELEATAMRARLEAATAEERRSTLARLDDVLADQIVAVRRRLALEEERAGSLDTLERTLAERHAAVESDAAALAKRSEEVRQEWEAARDRARTADRARRETEQEAAAGRERMAELRVERTRLGAEEERANAALRILDEQVRAELGIADDEPLPDPSAIEIEPASDRVSQNEVRDLQRLRRRLMALEPVNPLAEGELAEVAGRHDFLTAQKDDIERAMGHLRTLSEELARAIAEQFSATLQAVDREFGVFFARLFNGGTASLRLSEDDDEAGIDILARPPGKRLTSLAQLSGGERALTATALLLAILRVKPAPFCILDEVDAALDERNVGRFTEALRELTDHTQFVVITHNRGTIEAADTLYGVSMDAGGVSKVVSLRLADLEKERAG